MFNDHKGSQEQIVNSLLPVIGSKVMVTESVDTTWKIWVEVGQG